MSVVNHDNKWLFLCEPHTASRGTSEALLKLPGSQTIGHHHQTLTQLTDPMKEGTTPLEELIGYDVICTVRNPLDVIVTHWKVSSNSRRDQWPFDKWLKFNIHTPMVNIPLHRMLWSHCNIICYYEHLQEDLDRVFKQPVPLGYDEKHKTRHKEHWSTYYHNGLLDYIMIYYQNFFDNFGYYFDGQLCVRVDQSVRQKRVRPIGRQLRRPLGGI